MKIGIVCPYSLDRPGGVQLHVTNLADALIDIGHDVRVLAPSASGMPVPGYVDPAGRSFPVSYNGSVARIKFGIIAAARVRVWLREGKFDVVHLHEPGAFSLALIAMWARRGPTVATFHTSNDSSAIMRLAKPFIKPGMEVLDARIAVSPSADRTIKEHLRLDATHIIPNGVSTKAFIGAPPKRSWQGTRDRPTIGILGRLDEPRKGLGDFLDMIPLVRDRHPGARFLVAGRYSNRVGSKILAAGAENVGELDESLKQRFMSSVDVYCAPNAGGESFGIVLVEAMAAGAAVVASDLAAFRDVATAQGGEPCIALHKVGDAEDLARKVTDLLGDAPTRIALARRGQRCGALFDWDKVAPRIEATYREAIRMNAEH
ncbi:MAG: glycosyltransferase family 4 protein [Demequinaceae bacterium]|nr:glycosyltransferase family 4 protein [Demequinaceae bacterium]